MGQNLSTSAFQDLAKIFGVSDEPFSEKEIIYTLNRINKALISGGIGVKEITPEGFYKQEGWKNGLVHEVFSEEYYQKFSELLIQIREKLSLTKLVVLEVGAGNGNFTKQLKTKLPENISITATDISPASSDVKEYSYEEAIEYIQPDIIIACWPLIIANTEGESLFIRKLIKSKCIKGCFLIGVPSRCEFDECWFAEYQEESGASFTNIMDIPELCRLQIGNSRGLDVSIKNGVNPLVLGDQGIDDSWTLYLGNTYTTSRTSYISRGNPKW